MELAHHTGVYGMTGMGKSYLAKRLIVKHSRVLYLDVNDEASQHGRKPGPLQERITALDLSRHPGMLLKGPRLSLALVPDKPSPQARAKALELVWSLLERIADHRKSQPLLLVLDEVGDYAELCNSALRSLATRGLTHLHTSLLVIAQRPFLVPKTVRSQMGELYLFRIEEVDDAEAATERMRPDPKKFCAEVQALPPHKFIRWRPSLSTDDVNPQADGQPPQVAA